VKVKILKAEPSPRKIAGVSIRPFPYPFRAALAVCSDIDDTTPALFTAVHRLLNGNDETEFGPGLGLEIADSLFVWSHNPSVLSLLDEQDQPTPHAPVLAGLARLGWLDSLHALGDFNASPRFNRSRARTAYKALEELGIRLRIWINHGNSNNTQNFYARLGPSFSGDDPGSASCHHDLAADYGISYYWWHELTDLPLSAVQPNRIRLDARLLSNSTKNAVKRLLGNSDMIRPSAGFRELALPLELRDGGGIWAFTRFSSHPDGIWTRPGRRTLRHQLSANFLDRLTRWGGYALVYTHLGQPQWDGESPPFEDADLQALRGLKEWRDKGLILVAATSRLLDWWVLNRFLDWSVKSAPGGSTISIHGVDDPIEGFRELAESELQGLAFYADEPGSVRVELKGRPIDGFKEFEPDFSGNGGIYLPWKALELPPDDFIF